MSYTTLKNNMDYKALYEQSQKELFGLQFDFDEKNKQHTERYVHLMNKKNRLEKEIEALNEEVNDRVAIEDIASLFGKDEDDFDWEDEIGALVMENRELKKEIETMKQINSNLGIVMDLCK